MTPRLATDFLMQTYKRWPIELVSGRGCKVFDTQGRAYIDLVAGIAVASVGHAHPVVAEAVADQVRTLVHVSNLYATAPQAVLAERLAGLTGGMHSFFANSGAEAIECALKLARKRGGPNGKFRVIAAEGSFHGRTFGALAATGQPSKRKPFGPMLPGFEHVAFGDADALKAAMTDDVAAVLLEPIQGEAGVIIPPDGYIESARDLCDEWGALLILDEIQTGLGRTGKWFAHQRFGIEPDVMCLAKALAGGLPIGACLASSDVATTFGVGDHASTFGGGPVQCSAALAVLDIIDSEDLVNRSAAAGRRLMDGLARICGQRAEVRGRGLLIGVELQRPVAREIAERALEGGVLVNDATSSVVRFTPPLVISDEDIDDALTVLATVFGGVLEEDT